MPIYTPAPIYSPQAITAGAAAPLVFTLIAGGTGFVPAQTQIQISTLHVCNNGNVSCPLAVWRVPVGSGGTSDVNLVLPFVNIPVATVSNPWFDLSTLWGAQLRAGDAIYARADVANFLSVHGDGVIIQL